MAGGVQRCSGQRAVREARQNAGVDRADLLRRVEIVGAAHLMSAGVARTDGPRRHSRSQPSIS